MKKILIGLVALILVGGGVWYFGFRDGGESEETHTHEDGSEHSHDTTDTTTDTDQVTNSTSVTITYTDDGFEPDSYTVSAGNTVTVQNNSSSVLDFASGDHPTHLENPELNAGEIAAGSSKTFTLSEKGTWSIHNHENDAHEATIVVE